MSGHQKKNREEMKTSEIAAETAESTNSPANTLAAYTNKNHSSVKFCYDGEELAIETYDQLVRLAQPNDEWRCEDDVVCARTDEAGIVRRDQEAADEDAEDIECGTGGPW